MTKSDDKGLRLQRLLEFCYRRMTTSKSFDVRQQWANRYLRAMDRMLKYKREKKVHAPDS